MGCIHTRIDELEKRIKKLEKVLKYQLDSGRS